MKFPHIQFPSTPVLVLFLTFRCVSSSQTAIVEMNGQVSVQRNFESAQLHIHVFSCVTGKRFWISLNLSTAVCYSCQL